MVETEDYVLELERNKGMNIKKKTDKDIKLSKKEIKMASGLLDL